MRTCKSLAPHIFAFATAHDYACRPMLMHSNKKSSECPCWTNTAFPFLPKRLITSLNRQHP